MRNQNSNELKENNGQTEEMRNINLNLWDLEASSFFLDKKANDFESTGTFNNTALNYNNNFNIIKTTKNENKEVINYVLNQVTKKYKHKSVNSSFVKNNKNNSSEKQNFSKIMKQKTNLIKNNKKKIYKMKNNSFCHNSNTSNNVSKDFIKKKTKILTENNVKSNPKPRLNNSVDYSNIKDIDNKILLNNQKKHHLNKSLSIENINHKFNNIHKKQCYSMKNNDNNTNNSLLNNNKKRLIKSNSIEKHISFKKNNLDTKNKKNSKDNTSIKRCRKLEKDQKINKNKSVVSKKSREDAERYTNYLAKKKIFTQDYELQNKLRKQKEEREAEKEMSQCTFKPNLYNNKYNNKIQSQKNDKKKTIYEKQSQWFNNLQKKKENEREKKINKDLQGCTFNPQLTSLPNYNNKKAMITSREQMGEENYYNKMKKARQIIQEKNKGDDLVERYDERRKKNLPRSMYTFGSFSQESFIPEDNINNNSYINNQNMKIKPHYSNSSIGKKYNINSMSEISNREIIYENNANYNYNINSTDNGKNKDFKDIKDINITKRINNNYIYNNNNNINNNYIRLNNSNNINNNYIFDNNSNSNSNNHNNSMNNKNISINDNLNSMNVKHKNTDNTKRNANTNQNTKYANYINNNNNSKKLSNTQKIPNKNIEIFKNNNNNISNYMKNINNSSSKNNKNISDNNNNKYINQYEKKINDFDDKFINDKCTNKMQLNSMNNIAHFLNPIVYNEEQEQEQEQEPEQEHEKEKEKENNNISTEAVTKTNSILSLQKKSTHSLPDRPGKTDNYFLNNNNKINQIQDIYQINKINNFQKNIDYNNNNISNNFNNINNLNQDEDFNRQKRMLMNELHNWNNFDDEESNEDN